MSVLGGHILKRALAVVGSDAVGYLKFKSKTTNGIGLDVATYLPAVTIKAQVQAVPRSQFQYMGLDFQRDYIRVYTESFVSDLQRDNEADRLIWGGQTYEVLSNTSWKKPQGFIGLLAVRV